MSYLTKDFDEEVTRLLQAGAVGFMPTDTIYGLSAAALNQSSVEKIHKIKKRDGNKPLIVLISDIEMLDVLSIDKKQAEIIKKYWPSALSVVFKSSTVPSWLQLGTQSLAVRVPAHKDLLHLIHKVGPIVSTSANLQNEPPVESAQQALAMFGEQLDFYVDGGLLNNQPSTIAFINEGKMEVIRPGAVKID